MRLPAGLDPNLIDWKSAKPVQEWQAPGPPQRRRQRSAGDRRAGGPGCFPDGLDGPRLSRLAGNFKIIMKWNRSTYFATSVGLLADGISGGTLAAMAK